MTGLVLAALLASARLPAMEEPLDMKAYALTAYGVRSAETVDASTVRVTLGAASGPAKGDARAWRIASPDDPAYRHEAFVRPVKASVVKNEIEFERPAGFTAPKEAQVPLERTVVDLALPRPLVKGKTYYVIGIGHDGKMVTAGRTAAKVNGAVKLWPAQAVGLRRLSSVGDGKIRIEFGAGYSPDGGNDLSAWAVTVNGARVKPRALGRRSKIDVYSPVGWPYKAILQHDIFLDLGQPLRTGDKVSVEVAEKVTAGSRTGAFVFDERQSLSCAIQANQIGYLPDGVKIAHLGCWMGSFPDPAARVDGVADASTPAVTADDFYGTKTAAASKNQASSSLAPFALGFAKPPVFRVVEAASGKTVFTGTAKLVHKGTEGDLRGNTTGANDYELDFTDLRKDGCYYLALDGVGRSASFKIAADVYREPFEKQAAGLFAQRCGIELKPPYSDWRRVACHTNGVVATTVNRWDVRAFGPFKANTVKDAAGCPVVLPVCGGHHDAGDYNPRSHLDVAQILLDAYERKPGKFRDGQLNIPERGNGIPDIVDEALWALRVWTVLQDEDGGVYNGTESEGDPNFVQTVELDDKGDYAYAKDSKASFLAAGAFAQAARVLASCGQKTMADEFRARAERAYRWGAAHPPAIKDAARFGEYHIAVRAYAAAELLNTMGKEAYFADFVANTPWSRNAKADLSVWGKYDASDAAYAFLRIPENRLSAEGKVLRTAVLAAVRREAEMFISGSSKMAYKFIRNPFAPISWGTGACQHFLRPVVALWSETGETKYRDWMIRTCDNTLGCNPLGLSYIVGVGSRTVRAPLHNSRYGWTGLPVTGCQVQGPLAKGDGYAYRATVYPAHDEGFAQLHSFVDCSFAIAMDEGTVEHQAETLAVFGLLLPD